MASFGLLTLHGGFILDTESSFLLLLCVGQVKEQTNIITQMQAEKDALQDQADPASRAKDEVAELTKLLQVPPIPLFLRPAQADTAFKTRFRNGEMSSTLGADPLTPGGGLAPQLGQRVSREGPAQDVGARGAVQEGEGCQGRMRDSHPQDGGTTTGHTTNTRAIKRCSTSHVEAGASNRFGKIRF